MAYKFAMLHQIFDLINDLTGITIDSLNCPAAKKI